MNAARGIILGLAVLTLVGACGQGERAKTDAAPEPPPITAWSDIERNTIFVPEGVLYTVANVNSVAVAEIGGVPDNAAPSWRTDGVGVRVPDPFEAQASGSRIRVTVRAAAQDANAVLGVAYSTSESGNSGWQQFPLTQTPTDYSFEYDVPVMQQGNGDFIGFRSYGDSRVQVYGYRAEVIGPSAAAPQSAP